MWRIYLLVLTCLKSEDKFLVVFDRFPNADQSANFLTWAWFWIVAYLNGLRLIKRDSSLFVMVVVVCWLYLISGFAIVTRYNLYSLTLVLVDTLFSTLFPVHFPCSLHTSALASHHKWGAARANPFLVPWRQLLCCLAHLLGWQNPKSFPSPAATNPSCENRTWKWQLCSTA